ncbi:hypothetical protein GY973_24020, partial [Escherichia coli]|uniref:hypothetical protein n=1 Tax=Escherichia coli TaxID=562 RepID=UPI0015C445CD|nr:hypothetical protein [Escherichia coli]
PQRVWAIATFVNLTYAAELLALSGWIAQNFGLAGIVAVLAGVALIGLACTRAIPPAPPVAQEARSAPAGSGWTLNRPAICGAL